LVRPGPILLGKCVALAILLQLESASDRSIADAKLAEPGSIFLGIHAAFAILLQPQSASERLIAFAEPVRPESIFLGKLVEIHSLLPLESRPLEFWKLSLW
jgi:hypothetical protein